MSRFLSLILIVLSMGFLAQCCRPSPSTTQCKSYDSLSEKLTFRSRAIVQTGFYAGTEVEIIRSKKQYLGEGSGMFPPNCYEMAYIVEPSSGPHATEQFQVSEDNLVPVEEE